MRTMLFAAAATLALSGAAHAQEVDAPAGTYVLDREHAQVLWRVSHMGFSRYTARFTNFNATLEFDPDDPEAMSVAATVDPTSVETDYLRIPEALRRDADFNAELQNQNWFLSADHPEITFVSTSVDVDEDYAGPGVGRATVSGDLTIRGVTLPATLDVVLNRAAPHVFSQIPTVGFSATGVVSRSAFGMTALEGVIGDEVEILIEAEFKHQESLED